MPIRKTSECEIPEETDNKIEEENVEISCSPKKPWYKNLKILGMVGVGVVLFTILIVVIIVSTKKKKLKSSQFPQFPQIPQQAMRRNMKKRKNMFIQFHQ